jgi:hypothetical protein
MFSKIFLIVLVFLAINSNSQLILGGATTNVGSNTYISLEQLNLQTGISAVMSKANAYLAGKGSLNNKLIGAFYQIVSGYNYYFFYLTKNGVAKVVIYHQPWTNTINITTYTVIDSTCKYT